MLQKLFLVVFGIVPLCIGVEGFATETASSLSNFAFSFGFTFILFRLLDAVEEGKTYH